jgi:hypothetical protein
MAWLIIGQLTWDYTTAVAVSFLIDTDHLRPIIKDGELLHPKHIRRIMINPKVTRDPKTGKKEDERNYLHSIFTMIILSAIVLLINFPMWIVCTIAYAVHLGFDMLDKSDYYPLFPLKIINIKWIIRYCSRQEFFFAAWLFIIRLILVFTHTRI